MNKDTLYLTMDDNTQVFVRQWSQVENPQGIVQIAHGMAEHSGRYQRFAQYCNSQGLIVVASDHRGHGYTGEKSGLMGYFAPENGFDRVVDDLYAINRWIQKQFPSLPIFLLGHSMGSFLTRRYLQKYGRSLAGAIIMGSGGDPGIQAKLGRLIAKMQMRKGPTKPSQLLDKMAFGSFNQGIENPRTKFDWLSREPEEVNKYLADPFCGIVCSSGFFYDLFTGLSLIHEPALIRGIPAKIPLLVVSGTADPVGKNGVGIKKFVAQMQKEGLENITTKLYPGARHELLNEINKEEVMEDLDLWLKQHLLKLKNPK